MSNDVDSAKSEKSGLLGDLTASVVVFLVALPLCLGIAIASGVPPAAGLITGIVGGLVVGFLAGSPLQVSGPAAGLAVLVYEIVRERGLEGLGIIVLVGGLLQVVAGLLRFGQWFRAVSPAVIHGMLAGIGVLIFASQFHVMVDDSPKGSGLANLASIPGAVLKGVFPVDGSAHHQAAGIGLLTIVTIVAWNLSAPKRLKALPAALVAVVFASATAYLVGLDVRYVQIPTTLFSDIDLSTFGNLHLLGDRGLLLDAAALALIASAETLLCATAVDKMHSGVRTNYDRELAAQGVGNMLCGALGALPLTGVIVRSSANVQAGATTRRSTIFHGAWLLLLVAALPFVLELIPTSALAAVLVFTGYKLVNPVAIRGLRSYGWSEVTIYAATVGTIVATDLLTGVVVGFALAAGKLLLAATRLTVEVEPGSEGGPTVVRLLGAASFLGLPRLAKALESLPAAGEVDIRFDRLSYADAACQDFLRGFVERYVQQGGRVHVCWDTLVSRGQASVDRSPPRDPVGVVLHQSTARELAIVSGRSES